MRVYKINIAYKIFVLLIFPWFVAFNVLMTAAALNHQPTPPIWLSLFLIAYTIALMSITIYFWIISFTTRVVVRVDCVERRNLFGTTQVLLDERTEILIPDPRRIFDESPIGRKPAIDVTSARRKLAPKVCTIKISRDRRGLVLMRALGGVDELRDYLLNFEQEVILPSTFEIINQGKQLTFGKYTIDTRHIVTRYDAMCLDEIGAISVHRRTGEVALHHKSDPKPTMKLKAWKIPNAHTLVAVLSKLSSCDVTYR